MQARLSNPAYELEELITAWKTQHPQRSHGGWWALAGFSYQSALYLLHFFRGVHSKPHRVSGLAQTERLSDIFAPSENCLTLIQVKRTLDSNTLKAALQEVYAIAGLCSSEFLRKIRFQIACLKRSTRLCPQDFAPRDVIGETHDAGLWQAVLEQFDRTNAIIEEPDPLEQLHHFLWSAGISASQQFLERCLGMLFESFANPTDESIVNLAHRLASEFEAAKKCVTEQQQIGHVITPDDLSPEPAAYEDTKLVIETRPRFADLRKGRFRERTSVMPALRAQFDSWWERISQSKPDKLPVFWIGGRSGDGKSVLLLQLAAQLVSRPKPITIVALDSADQLPHWIEFEVARRGELNDTGWQPTLALVDDLHAVQNPVVWEDELRTACRWEVPNVAVLCCGPTAEYEIMTASGRDCISTHLYSVPHLDEGELIAFKEWLSARSGISAEFNAEAAANRLLVQWLFELTHNAQLGSFAKCFRSRLQRLGVLEPTMAILAANALELPGPSTLVRTSDRQRDHLQRLCEEDQMHFVEARSRQTGELCGYQIAHPQIGWQLYCEMSASDSTLAVCWARDLSKAVTACFPDYHKAKTIVHRLITSRRLEEIRQHALPGMRIGTIEEALRELYYKQTENSSGTGPIELLASWLQVLSRFPALQLHPSPIESACQVATKLGTSVPAAVAGWLWLLGENEHYGSRSAEFQAAVRCIFDTHPSQPDAGHTLAQLLASSRDKNAIKQLAWRWLERNSVEEQALPVISSLLAFWPAEPLFRGTLAAWLRAHPTHPRAYWFLTTLVARWPGDAGIRDAALNWFKENSTHPEAYQLLAALTSRWYADITVRDAALLWLSENPSHHNAYSLLIVLIAGWPDDPEVYQASTAWLERNERHPEAYHLLVALVARRRNDKNIRDSASTWLNQNRSHVHGYHLLAALVAAWPNDSAVRDMAVRWLNENQTHSCFPQLLSTLISRWPNYAGTGELMRAWLKEPSAHNQLHRVLPPLIAKWEDASTAREVGLRWLMQNPEHGAFPQVLMPLINRFADTTIREQALEWLNRNQRHGNGYLVLVTLIGHWPDDAVIRDLAIAWLNENPLHRNADQLLASLVTRWPRHPVIWQRAVAWWDANKAHKSAPLLLGALISISGGAERWMDEGEKFLDSPQGRDAFNVLGALVKASNGRPKYVERALAALEQPHRENKGRYLYQQICRALAYNLSNTLACLSGVGSESRKLAAAKALSDGLAQHQSCVFRALGQFEVIPHPYRGFALAGCIRSNFNGPKLLHAIRDWLNGNVSQDGYDAVLSALVGRPDLWLELRTTGPLDQRVSDHYETRRSKLLQADGSQ